MSWLYSRALVEASLEEVSWAGELSVLSSVTHTPQAYSSHGKTTGASRLSRFGMTCEPLTDVGGTALLMWFRAGFPARTSASQEKAQESTASDQDSGDTWRGWSAKYDPGTSTWRTAQCSFLEDSGESSVTWPRSGMTRDGMLWELPTLEPRTSETDSGSWPTPTASGFEVSDVPRLLERRARLAEKYGNNGFGLTLNQAVKIWPTPTVCGNYNRAGASAKSGDGLATAVWATPVRRDYRYPGRSRLERTGGTQGECLPQQVGGPLNPTWVEWLMGWPLGWTDLKPLETGKFQEWQQQHGRC